MEQNGAKTGLRPGATLVFKNLKKDSTIVVDGNDKTGVLKENKLEVSSGKHIIKVSQIDAGDFEQSVELSPLAETEITVTYTQSKEYILSRLKERTDRAEAALNADASSVISMTLELETIEKEIVGTGEKNTDLQARVNNLIRDSLEKDKAALSKRIKDAEDGQGLQNLLRWGTIGVFAIGTGTAVMSQVFSA